MGAMVAKQSKRQGSPPPIGAVQSLRHVETTRALGLARVEALKASGAFEAAQILEVSIERRAQIGRRGLRPLPAPGHDGDLPDIREPSVAEWEKDQAPKQNYTADRLEWLAAQSLINECQKAAGQRYERDFRASLIGGYASPSPDGGFGGGAKRPGGLQDGKCDAVDRVNRAMLAVGFEGECMLHLVVLKGWSCKQIADAFDQPEKSVLPVIRVFLNLLAQHYERWDRGNRW